MKNKGLLITILIFFLIINTNYYWEPKLGLLVIPVYLILAVVYLGLTFSLFSQIYFIVKENFTNKFRLLTTGILTIVLTLTFFKPFGFIDFERFEGEDILVIQREGVANCMTTLKLKEDFTFKEINVCFGISEVTGNYRIENDTIYFKTKKDGRKEVLNYEFAII